MLVYSNVVVVQSRPSPMKCQSVGEARNGSLTFHEL
jgi:hypothetical protein